ncbi:ABC transporter permease [Arthrobacter sp. G119Y2]|uniref:ABC transporter permease n=1 Tax=Arthrobacter sp. G119Y2 TaxID=3134965 RepID=UPI0031198E84
MSTTATRDRSGTRMFGWFLAKRLVQAAVVIAIVSIVVFMLLQALPGGPARGILGQQATEAQIEAFNHEMGFDLPLVQQYLNYAGQWLRGDLGRSFVMNTEVSDVIMQRLPKTLVLALTAVLGALVVAIPLGMAQALRRNKPFDYVMTGLNFIVYSTPSFFLGLLLIMLFSQVLGWLPANAPQGNSVAEILAHPKEMILPVLTSGLAGVATFSRYMRSSTIDNLHEDYVRTARAKGTPANKVVFRHVLRNSLTPVVTMLGYYLPVMFGGALVVEQLFNFPGMGLLFWNAAQTSDFPVLLGCVLVISVATVIGSLLADITQFILDPRARGGAR